MEHHPEITFTGNQVEVMGEHDYALTGDLTIRGVTHQATLSVSYLGQWETPWWEDGADKGPRTRAGFLATTTINRHDFGVSWQDRMDRGGIVVSNEVDITIVLKRFGKAFDWRGCVENSTCQIHVNTKQINKDVTPSSEGCEDCLKTGDPWLHLRLCDLRPRRLLRLVKK